MSWQWQKKIIYIFTVQKPDLKKRIHISGFSLSHWHRFTRLRTRLKQKKNFENKIIIYSFWWHFFMAVKWICEIYHYHHHQTTIYYQIRNRIKVKLCFGTLENTFGKALYKALSCFGGKKEKLRWFKRKTSLCGLLLSLGGYKQFKTSFNKFFCDF